MLRGIIIVTSFLVISIVNAQIVRLDPSGGGADDEVRLIFDATQGNGELVGAAKVYIHHGVITDSPTGTAWDYVIGNWGADDGVGEMTRVAGETDQWEITFSPSVREYFGVPEGENIFRISCVLRSADGGIKGTIDPGEYGWGTVAANQDIYVNLDNSSYVSITKPSGSDGFFQSGEMIDIEASASSTVTEMKLWLDEGAGYVEKASVNGVTKISYTYTLAETIDLGIKITATIDGEQVEAIKQFNAVVRQAPVVEPLPEGIHLGINYHDDQTKVTLALQAPGKEFSYVVGDFSNWKVKDQYLMKHDGNETFWVELDSLMPQKSYVYQYWVEGEIKIGDPYADQVADPWNDKYIEAEIFPELPDYERTEYEIATVFKTGQSDYQWASTEASWERPDLNHLVIYELHIRDFLGSHSYLDLIDTIGYLKRLGVDAIELMPISEFEGNDSWGYNPSYYFAIDKYYGTKDHLKQFIETAHQEGMAVILDMVLNHSFGQSPMVRLYFDKSTGKVTSENPWYNATYVGPFEWGYDFNHTSQHVKNFIDSVNTYWISEFHFDGFRFDFTKGFTQNGSQFESYNSERINILKRMADVIWDTDPESYVILEHWGPGNEEDELAAYGMKMWRNKSYDFVPAILGNTNNNFEGTDATSHMTLISSHDEQRIAYEAINHGKSSGTYDIKIGLNALERIKMGAAFHLLNPGPKLIWQFDELGYDVNIDFNGRTGRKPIPWGEDGLGYYEDPNRQHVYSAYKGILDVRKQIKPGFMLIDRDHQLTGAARRLSYNTPDKDLVVIGNFGLSTETIDPRFSMTGTWYDYFSGEEFNVTDVNGEITLAPGEWHIYTSDRLSDGMPGVVEIFSNPVIIEPEKFRVGDEITITFDASQATNDGTNGLMNAGKVYMHAGIVTEDVASETLTNIVGTLTDDGLGEMTSTGNDLWEITLTPKDYFSVNAEEVFRLGMYFRDATNENVGKGFRNSIIYYNVLSETSIVTIEPAAFDINTEITITFDAKRGNGALIDASDVYMHSGVGLEATNNPGQNAWNNVVGNWGEDDGEGELIEVEDDIWQITLTPKSYYGLADGDVVYWIAMVFRNADGDNSLKATATSEELPNGIVAESGDFFVRNGLILSSGREELVTPLVYPNPTNGYLNLSQFSGQVNFHLFNLGGMKVYEKILNKDKLIFLNSLSEGIYIYKIESVEAHYSGKLVIE